MTPEEIINELRPSGKLAPATIKEIQGNKDLRMELVRYFDRNKNREFALGLLSILSELRKDPNMGISGDTLMLACYLLGKHGQIEDCIEIWKTKRIDFDTYCYIDIQLVAFAGAQETIEYLKKQTSEEAERALDYVVACAEAGDFDHIEKYYKGIPWFV